MGFLHEGHLSLVRIAQDEGDVTVVSIFVNPTQFAANEDLASYPRDLARDEKLCRRAGADILFCPTRQEMYADDSGTVVVEPRLSAGLCGASRPGHFCGVATVVAKLFNIVQPDVAVFGQKDAQQVRVIDRMARDLKFRVRIVVGPIVREADGLALSSRNAYLTAEERQRAPVLYRALQGAEAVFAAGERDASVLKARVREVLREGAPIDVEYVEIVDYDSLQPLERVEGKALVAIAARIGKPRLIDNTILDATALGCLRS